jgi:hypothetical protein
MSDKKCSFCNGAGYIESRRNRYGVPACPVCLGSGENEETVEAKRLKRYRDSLRYVSTGDKVRDRGHEAICSLIEYLRSFQDEDRERGLMAAENIERTLIRFIAERRLAVSVFSYDVGGKGMLDLIWTAEHRKQLEKYSDEIYGLIDAT